MEVFESLLNNAVNQFKANKFDKAFEDVHAAMRYLKGVIDAQKQLSQEPPQKP